MQRATTTCGGHGPKARQAQQGPTSIWPCLHNSHAPSDCNEFLLPNLLYQTVYASWPGAMLYAFPLSPSITWTHSRPGRGPRPLLTSRVQVLSGFDHLDPSSYSHSCTAGWKRPRRRALDGLAGMSLASPSVRWPFSLGNDCDLEKAFACKCLSINDWVASSLSLWPLQAESLRTMTLDFAGSTCRLGQLQKKLNFLTREALWPTTSL